MEDLKGFIREIQDFPKEGIVFYDITTLLQNPQGLRRAVDQFVWLFASQEVDKVVGIESRGFLFGPVVAYNLNAGFVPVQRNTRLTDRLESRRLHCQGSCPRRASCSGECHHHG